MPTPSDGAAYEDQPEPEGTEDDIDPSGDVQHFRDFTEILGGDAGIALPIAGRTYRIRPCDAETGLYLTGLFAQIERYSQGRSPTVAALEGEELDDDQERALMRRVLGDALDQMITDRVPWPAVQLAMAAGWAYHVHGRDAALAIWNAGGDPKAAAPPPGNRATRRATAAANTTRQRDSMSGTSSPPGKARGRRRNRGRGRGRR